MLARPVGYLNRIFHYLKVLHPQKYVNIVLTLIGLSADLIALGTYFGAIHTPETGSNFYVNGREFLAWVVVAIVYSTGLINAAIRRRWRRLYGDSRGDHSIFNFFSLFNLSDYSEKDRLIARIQFRNFQRDFSFLYVVMFAVALLINRAVNATEAGTNITPSPWGNLVATLFLNIPLTIGMMVITSMFDFAMSMFLGDQTPESH